MKSTQKPNFTFLRLNLLSEIQSPTTIQTNHPLAVNCWSKPGTLRGDIVYLPRKGGYNNERTQNGDSSTIQGLLLQGCRIDALHAPWGSVEKRSSVMQSFRRNFQYQPFRPPDLSRIRTQTQSF